MNRKETERKIKRSFENAAPDRLDEIKKRLNKATDADGVVPMHRGKKKKLKDRSIIYTGVLAAVAAVLLIVNGIMIIEQGNRTKKEEMTVARTLTLDLENSVALDVNAVGQVVTVKTLDKDTAEIINGLDLTGTPSDVAVNAIVGAMYQKGCLGGEVTDIVVTETDPVAAEPENSEPAGVSADEAEQSSASSENSAVTPETVESASDEPAEKPEDTSVSVDSAAVAALADNTEEGKKAAVTIALADAGIKTENATVTRAGFYTLGDLIFGTELNAETSYSDKPEDTETSEQKNDGDDKKAEDKKTEDKKADESAKTDEASDGKHDDKTADTEDTADEDADKKDSENAAADALTEDAKDSASENSAEKKESSSSSSKKTYVSPILSGMGDMDKKVWFVEFTSNGYTYSSIIDLEGKVIYYSRKSK
ncbi:MAG: hypothetical protein J6N47_01305 [Lachnospiraceae bacterium]|nr:hypothetical protein [Lachnospiraceae bacterium]